ncbi:MAG TPA: hypothetical protein VFZ58_04580 [Candidatus Saccharimonadales bacterium]
MNDTSQSIDQKEKSLPSTDKLRIIYGLLAFAIPAVVFLLVLLWGEQASLALSLALAFGVFLYSVAAIVLFKRGLRGFKRGLRSSYRLIFIGAILYGIAQLQFPLIFLFPALFFLAETGLVTLPFVLSVSFILIGTRRFGKLLDIRGPWLSLWAAYIAATVAAVLSSFIPHIPIEGMDEISIDVANGLNIWIGTIVFFAVMITKQIRAAAALRYSRALGWMIASLGALVFASFIYAVVSFLLPPSHWYFVYNLPLVPSLLGTVLLFQAGYSFTKVSSDSIASKSSSPIDVVLYAASLASNARDIDPALDKLRIITAGLEDRTTLSPQQEEALTQTYLEIENYLVHRETLKEYSAEDIHEVVRNRFQVATNNSAFWRIFKL